MCPQEVTAGALGEERDASTADTGTALTTTATFIRLPRVTNHIRMIPRNWSTAVLAKYHLNPWLTILKTVNALTTTPTDYSNAGQDLSAAAASVVLSDLDTLANGDFLLVGSHLPIRGVLVDVNATNAGAASTLAVKYTRGTAITAMATSDSGAKTIITATHAYSNGDIAFITGTRNYDGSWVVEQVVGTTTFVIAKPFVTDEATGVNVHWSDITPTDGTASGGKTFAQDGNVTWTVPTDWKSVKLSNIYTSAPAFTHRDTTMYWTRWDVSAALDASVTIDRMLSMNRNTANYASMVSGLSLEQRIRHAEPGGIGNVEALTDAGTANLVVTALCNRDGGFI